MSDTDTGMPAGVESAIDDELERRFASHAGDPLYDEIRRVLRAEKIAAAQQRSDDV